MPSLSFPPPSRSLQRAIARTLALTLGGILLFSIPAAATQNTTSPSGDKGFTKEVASNEEGPSNSANRSDAALPREAMRDSLLQLDISTHPERVVHFADLLLRDTPKVAGIHEIKALAQLHLSSAEALETATTAVDLAPNSARAHWAFAAAARDLGKHDAALDVLESFLNRHPEDLTIRTRYAQALMDAERYEEAVAEYELLLEVHPELYMARTQLIEAHYRAGDVERALATAEDVLRQRPMSVYALRSRANVYLREGRYMEAARDLTREIEIRDHSEMKSDDIPFVNRAFVRVHKGDIEAAENDIDRAFELRSAQPQQTLNAYAFRSRALVRLAQGEEQAACEDLRQAVELGYADQFGRWARYGPDAGTLHQRHCETASR